jgi:DNA adenine methylase
VEPFGGSAVVLLNKPPSKVEVINDVNHDIVNFFRQLRERKRSLITRMGRFEYSRYLYQSWLSDWRNDNFPDAPLERAARWAYLQLLGFSGSFGAGWRHSREKNLASEYYRRVARLEKVARRLRRVQIEESDFAEVIATYDSSETVFYVDPPYLGLGTHQAGDTYYGVEFPLERHQELARILNSVRGKVVLSYYPYPLLDEWYADWRRHAIPQWVTSKMRKGEGTSNQATELLLFNYEPMPLFRGEGDV